MTGSMASATSGSGARNPAAAPVSHRLPGAVAGGSPPAPAVHAPEPPRSMEESA